MVLSFMAAYVPAALSESVGLSWKPSPSVGAAGYHVYYGVSGSFTNKQDAGNQLSTTITDLQAGNSYFFFATTYDAGGDESGPSEVVIYHVNSAPQALDVSAETLSDQPIAIRLLGNDSDGDALSYEIVNAPLHGAVSGLAADAVYTPSLGYIGPDAFTYKVNDGKTDSQPATVSIAVLARPDVTPPAVAVIAPAAGGTVSDTVTITIAAADDTGIAKVELYLNGRFAGTAASAPVGFAWNTREEADGPATIQAKAYDLSGNASLSEAISVSVRNYVPDTAEPSVSILSPIKLSTVSGATVIQISATDNVAVTMIKCFVNGALIGATSSAAADFPWDTTQYANGSYTIMAQAVDAAGNSAVVSTSGIVVENKTAAPDTTPPSVGILSPANGETVAGIKSVTVEAVDDQSVVDVELYFDGELVASSESGTASFDLDTTGVADGLHTLEVRAHDEAGNEGLIVVEVDVQNVTDPVNATDPPVVEITSPRDGTVIRKNFGIKIRAIDDVSVVRVELYLNGELSGVTTSRNPSFTVVASKLSSGDHVFEARAYDAENNVGISSSVTVTK